MAVGLLERELGRFDAVDDSEAVEHLGGEQVVRRQPAKVRGVVARDEWLDELEDPLGRHALDRDETIPDERPVGRVDDGHAVDEVVQTHGVEVELSRVGRIARKEPRVPVSRPERGDDAQHSDEELVARDARGALREGAHVGLETLARHAPERVGVDPRDLRAELANVVRRGDVSGGTGLRRGDDRDHGE